MQIAEFAFPVELFMASKILNEQKLILPLKNVIRVYIQSAITIYFYILINRLPNASIYFNDDSIDHDLGTLFSFILKL